MFSRQRNHTGRLKLGSLRGRIVKVINSSVVETDCLTHQFCQTHPLHKAQQNDQAVAGRLAGQA